MHRSFLAFLAAVSCFGLAGPSGAVPLSVRDSFRIGNGGTIFCSAQSVSTDKALKGMFDIGYSLTCRDAALPVGKMYKLRDSADARARISAARDDGYACTEAKPGRVEGLGPVEFTECKLKDADVAYQVYALRKGKALEHEQPCDQWRLDLDPASPKGNRSPDDRRARRQMRGSRHPHEEAECEPRSSTQARADAAGRERQCTGSDRQREHRDLSQ